MGMVAKMYDDEEAERSRVMGYVLGGIATGVLIGYPMGGFLFDFVGKFAPFLIICFMSLVLIGLQLESVWFGEDDLLEVQFYYYYYFLLHNKNIRFCQVVKMYVFSKNAQIEGEKKKIFFTLFFREKAKYLYSI